MRPALFSLLLVACGASTSVPTPPQHTPPSARDVMLALSAHADLDPPDESCTHVTGDLDHETLGVIEAHLLAQAAEAQAEGETATTTVSCEAAGPPWRCLFEVRIDAEDPWRYGISFSLDAAGAIDPASITCPGG
jgi:hypothetical protein